MLNYNIVISIGFIGQFFFSLRFLVQWIQSEKKHKSIIPFSFWIFSILGSLLLLTYAIYKKDPVFILGQSIGLVIYLRNIYLIKKVRLDNGKKKI